MKKLSIIIPIYNGEKFIIKCINSIIKELDDKIEVLLINDGSTDSSETICKKFISKNVKLISNSNHGVSYSRNNGIDLSIGEYIMFLDIDDYLSNGWRKKIFDVIDKNDFDVAFFSKEYTVLSEYNKEILIQSIFGVSNNVKWISTPWSKVFKRKFLLKNKIYFTPGIINGEDMLFNAKVLINTDNYLFKNENIYNYRIVNTSVTKSFNNNIFDSDIKFQEELIKILSTSNINFDKISKHCIQNALIMFIRKISMVKLKNSKQFFYIFKQEPYQSYINSKNNVYESFKNKFFIKLLKIKKYKFTIIIMKIFRTIKQRKTKKEYFIKI